jgi:glycosyltransferase involved in cell wall biosynthesis
MIKISVITAVYNRAEFVCDAVRSLQNQTWPNIEHLVIDGASTDETLNVLYKCLDEHTILVSEPDDGMYHAINKGIALSSGDVIGLLHSDDFYADDYVLESVAEAFANPKVQAVYGDLDYVGQTNPLNIIRCWRSGDYTPEKLKYGWMPPHPTLFLRRSVIERWGVFDTSFKISADYDAILRYFSRGEIQPFYVPRVFIKMRLGGNSNKSLAKIWLKTREDYIALRNNEVGGFWTLLNKNFRKIMQFWEALFNQP